MADVNYVDALKGGQGRATKDKDYLAELSRKTGLPDYDHAPSVSDGGDAEPMGIIDDPSRMAGASTLAVGSLPSDDETRARYISKQMFPNDPAALDRFSWNNGRLAYKGDDGKRYYAEGALDPRSFAKAPMDTLRSAGKAMAGGVGPAIPAALETGAGLATASLGPAASISASAGAGALGDAIRQVGAKNLAGDQSPYDVSRTLGEAGMGALDQSVGLGMAKGMSRFGRTPSYDLSRASPLLEKSAAVDVPLTAAESSNNRALLRRQKILQNTTNADETFHNFYEFRNDKVRDAVEKITGKITPANSVREASESAVEGAKDAVAKVQDDLRQKAAPLYKKAIDDRTDRFWNEDLEKLMQRPSMEQGIARAQWLAKEEGRDLTVPTFENGKLVGRDFVPDWRSWDYIKRGIDSQIQEIKTKNFGRGTPETNAMEATKRKMLGILDKENPDYKAARGVFQENVPSRNMIERGTVGDMSKLQGSDVSNAARMMFSPVTSSAEDVRAAKQAFFNAQKSKVPPGEKTDPVAISRQWNDLVGSWLRDQFETIPDSAVGSITNIGGTYRKRLMGSARKRAIMNAALDHDPEIMQNFNWLMDTLEATGRASKGESITAFAQQGQKELQREASGIIGPMVETIEVWNTPSRFRQWINDVNMGRYADQQAKLLTSPDGIEKLKELRTISPTSKGAVLALSHLLMSSGEAAAGDYARGEPANGPVRKK